MQHFGSYLAKLEKFLPLETRVRLILISFLQEKYSFFIDRKVIRVQKGIVFIDAEPVVRAKILQKKQFLIAGLREKGIHEITNIL